MENIGITNRVLVLTRGIPGSGKSTWIRVNHLTDYTLCPDTLRIMFGGHEFSIDGKCGISQRHDKTVWKTLFDMLERRMQLGLFTVIDATHTKTKSINQYKKLCLQYGYTCYVKDFSNVTLDECKKRNCNKDRVDSNRFVPDDVLERMQNALETSNIPDWAVLL